MGRPYWAIDPQWAWLMLQSIEYMRIKNTIYPTKSDKWKAFKIFWAKYFEEWARQWPSPGLNAVVKEEPLSEGELCNDNDLPESDGDNAPRQKQTGKQKGPLTRLKQWINNHTRPVKGEGKPAKLDLSGKTEPKWQAYQAYSYLYYDTRLRDIIEPEYANNLASHPEETKATETLFAFRNRRLRELLELEPEDVKSAVEELRLNSPTLKEQETLEKMMSEGLSEAAAKEALRAGRIHALPGALANTMDQILEQTGMMGFVMLMGPNPNAPTEVMTMLYQTGRTANGLNFKETYRDFDTAIRDPLNTFAHKCIFIDKSVGNTPEPSGSLCADASTAKTDDMALPSHVLPTDAPNPNPSSINNHSAHAVDPAETMGNHNSTGGDHPDSMEDDSRDGDLGELSSATKERASINKKTPGTRQRAEPKQYRISEYEQERDSNIARNKLLFQAMGLDEFTEDLAMGLRNPGAPGKAKRKVVKKPPKPKATKPSKSLPKRTTRQNKTVSPHTEDTEMVSDALTGPSTSTPADPSTSPNPNTTSPPTDAAVNKPAVTPSSVHLTRTPATSTAGWMAQDRGALDKVFVSPVGQEMLDDWVSFEGIMGPQDAKKVKLAKKSRPQPLDDWLSRQRQHNTPPPIGTPLEYGTSWCAWWRSIQPRWRREGPMVGDMALVRRDVDDESWLNVAKAGANGLVIALISLSWWFVAAKEESDRRWCVEAIEDVAWVVKQLVRRFAKAEEAVDGSDEEGAQRGQKRARRG